MIIVGVSIIEFSVRVGAIGLVTFLFLQPAYVGGKNLSPAERMTWTKQ